MPFPPLLPLNSYYKIDWRCSISKVYSPGPLSLSICTSTFSPLPSPQALLPFNHILRLLHDTYMAWSEYKEVASTHLWTVTSHVCWKQKATHLYVIVIFKRIDIKMTRVVMMASRILHNSSYLHFLWLLTCAMKRIQFNFHILKREKLLFFSERKEEFYWSI